MMNIMSEACSNVQMFEACSDMFGRSGVRNMLECSNNHMAVSGLFNSQKGAHGKIVYL